MLSEEGDLIDRRNIPSGERIERRNIPSGDRIERRNMPSPGVHKDLQRRDMIYLTTNILWMRF